MSYKRKRITVKIGSNVLARPDGTLDITRMSALTDQIAKLHKAGVEIIVISSGAVASGRSELKIHRKLDAVSARQLFSAVGQAKLINRYYELFREHNIACGQVLTTKENFSTRRQYLTQKQCMEVMLENKVIPIGYRVDVHRQRRTVGAHLCHDGLRNPRHSQQYRRYLQRSSGTSGQ